MSIISTRATGRKVYCTSLKPHLITNIAIIEERGRLKQLSFKNEIIINKKEYDIRLVASLQNEKQRIFVPIAN